LAVVFVKEQGAYLRKKSRRVIVEKNSEKIKEIQMQKLNGVVLYGNIQVSTQLMKEFFDRGIDITYMSKKGRYLGSAKSYLSKNIFIKLSQYDKYNNEEFKVKFMKAIISAKSYNQKSLIKIYNWRNSKNDFEKNILNIEKIIAGL
jgi:CRISPR-associated protein Cas1